MNDPNKVINVNLSSLLSLKAELLRKQAEVSKAKISQSTSLAKKQEYTSHYQSNKQCENYENNISDKKTIKNKLSGKNEASKETIACELEDAAMLQKSQRVLEAKTKFYERMEKTGGRLNSDDNCLVMFNKKKQEDKQKNEDENLTICSTSEDSSENEEYDDHPDDWVEYIDCLGRTRKCLKRDLSEAKRRDEKLAASMPERLDQTKANWMIDTVGCHKKASQEEVEDNKDAIGPLPPTSIFGDGLSTMSKLEEQKANWERKEQENVDKIDVHYQDLFFDEARQHGVGYYAFSTDEEERRKQQKELEKARQETLEEQKLQKTLRKQREKTIAERVFAAKNRQRARIGLPPLEKEDKESENKEEVKPEETKEQRKALKKAEKLEKKKQKEEEERKRERLEHVRPWDKVKDGISKKSRHEVEEEWKYKPEREPMTQEQWNEYKRNERINEFAPPPVPQENNFKRTNFKTTDNTFSKPNYMAEATQEQLGFSKYQSTRKFKRRYCAETTQQPEDDLPTALNNTKIGVCIPPPPNLEDFHLPSHNKKPKSSYELEKSIEAGLRFLRTNSDKEKPTTKSSWLAKADY